MRDTATAPEWIRVAGIVLAAALAGGAILGSTSRGRACAMLAALALTPVLLILQIWNTPQLAALREHPAVLLGVGAVAAAVVVVPLAVLFARRPAALAVAVLAALPFRVPIEAGGTTANLLVPLYLVMAAGALAWAVPRLRDGEAFDPPRRNGAMERLLVLAIVLYALQMSYSSSVEKALEQTAFFYVPFALLFAVIRDLDWSPRRLRVGFLVLLGMALVFVAVGFWEYATRTLLFNPKVIASNQIDAYFRVNSLFFDPNIYGRFLALVMIGLAGVLLWERRPREARWAAAGLAVLWGGLLLTLSQSSFAALLCGLLVLAALRFTTRYVVPVAAVIVLAGLVIVLAFPSALRLDLGSAEALDDATSGRYELIQGGVELARGRPIAGWGSGAFGTEYREQELASDADVLDASHTIPLTIAAEQGLIGLIAYLALLVAALRRLLHDATGDPYRSVIAACFIAVVVHTMLYAAFLEDPVTWVLLGIGGALAWPRQRSRRERPPAAQPALPPEPRGETVRVSARQTNRR